MIGEKVRVLNALKWKSERQQHVLRRKHISKWEKGQTRDGYIQVAEGMFLYRSFPYQVKVLRYFTFEDGFKPIIHSKRTDMHAVVETDNRVAVILRGFGCHEFMWHDTLNAWNEKQTINQQITACHNMAKRDIDNLVELGKKLSGIYGRYGAKGTG